MNKEMISKLNSIAQENFEKAKAMLNGINTVLGTKYGWLHKRVVFFEEPDAPAYIKYRNAHDAWVNAEEQNSKIRVAAAKPPVGRRETK